MAASSQSGALALWKLLATGAKLPHGTKHLVCDETLCEHVAVLMRRAGAPGVDFDLLAALFVACPEGPSPVKQAYALVSPTRGWISKEDPSEWRGMLVRWGAKNGRFPDGVLSSGNGPARAGRRDRCRDWTKEDARDRGAILRSMGAVG